MDEMDNIQQSIFYLQPSTAIVVDFFKVATIIFG